MRIIICKVFFRLKGILRRVIINIVLNVRLNVDSKTFLNVILSDLTFISFLSDLTFSQLEDTQCENINAYCFERAL